jgi:hypothetical protein
MNRDHFLVLWGGWSVVCYLQAGILSALVFAPLLAMFSTHLLNWISEPISDFVNKYKKPK